MKPLIPMLARTVEPTHESQVDSVLSFARARAHTPLIPPGGGRASDAAPGFRSSARVIGCARERKSTLIDALKKLANQFGHLVTLTLTGKAIACLARASCPRSALRRLCAFGGQRTRPGGYPSA